MGENRRLGRPRDRQPAIADQAKTRARIKTVKCSGIAVKSRRNRGQIRQEFADWTWEYEDQGYELKTGECYLPDFDIRLPTLEEWYVEVKPDNFDKFDQAEYMNKLRRFTSEVGRSLLILDGNPSYKPFDIVSHKVDGRYLGLAFLQDYDPYVRWVDEYWMAGIGLDERTGRFFTEHADDERMQRKSFGRQYVESLKAARNEKFGI